MSLLHGRLRGLPTYDDRVCTTPPVPVWSRAPVVSTLKCGGDKGPRSAAVIGIAEGVERLLRCDYVARVRWDPHTREATSTVELSVADLQKLLGDRGRL